jgi:exopolysaccharide biosynthesis polyprenyl glycosylphosphotransferase
MTQLLEALSRPSTSAVAPAPRTLGGKRRDIVFGYVTLAADAAALAATFLLAYMLRDRLAWDGRLLPIQEPLWGISVVTVWLLLACAMRLSGATALAERIAAGVSRVRVAPSAGGSHTRRLLVIGTTPAAARLHRLIQTRTQWNAEVAGFVTSKTPTLSVFSQRPVVGAVENLGTLLDTMVLDEVVVADTLVSSSQLDVIAQECLTRGVTFHVLVRMPSAQSARNHAEVLGDGLCLTSLAATPQMWASLSIKRVIDVAVACVGLIGCALVVCLFAPLLRLESAGPVIFRQTRVGRNGRSFTLYKLRTMRSDAEMHKVSLVAANEMRGPLFKMRNDPRITMVGRWLRRAYLDELPQFWNVLRGDMSLVGTRPPTPDEVATYAPHHRRRLSMRPGITGLWQTMGNGAVTDFEDVVRLDCNYIDRWSLWLDVRILLRTCVTVARLAGH